MSQITEQLNSETEAALKGSNITADQFNDSALDVTSGKISLKARKAAAEVDAAGKHEPLLRENGIPEEVLEKLLPGDEVITLAEPTVAGGIGYRFIKRTFDICSTGLALIVLAVPMAAIAIKIKSESPGPAIYAQERVGKDGKYFKVYKFRSMYIDAEARGARWAAGDDLPALLPLGSLCVKHALMRFRSSGTSSKGIWHLSGLVQNALHFARNLKSESMAGITEPMCVLVFLALLR